MRIGYGILVLSFSGLCGAVALPLQDQQPTAEQAFKNIVSFKGQKASDVIPAMQFMCGALKENCNFCHVEDRASDEKGPKRTAREMIAMQREINEKNFGGRNQVTCATCHAGHAHPINMTPAVGLEVRPRRSASIIPNDVLAAYARAAGADPATALPGLELKGTTETGGATAQFHVLYGSGKFALETTGAKGLDRQGFNGTVGWFSTPKGIQSVPRIYIADFINQHTFFVGPLTLPKLDGTSGGTATIGTDDELTVSGALADKTRLTLFFNKKSGLLDRSMFAYPSILGSIAQINDYSNYRKINGVMLPMKVVNHSDEGDTMVVYKSVKVRGDVPATTFDPPKS